MARSRGPATLEESVRVELAGLCAMAVAVKAARQNARLMLEMQILARVSVLASPIDTLMRLGSSKWPYFTSLWMRNPKLKYFAGPVKKAERV